MNKECYFCHKKQGKFNYVEWIPLFFRYCNVCDQCHEEKGIGDTIEFINFYESYLGSQGLGQVKLKDDKAEGKIE